MEENGEKTFKERIQESANMTKRIPITFPISVAERLDKYAKENCNDCYWLAIKNLLDLYNESKDKESSVKMLMERDTVNYERLSERLNELKSEFTTLLEQLEEDSKKKKKPTTFGGGKEK